MNENVRNALERVEQAIERSKQPRFGRKPDSNEVFFGQVLRWVKNAADEEPEYKADSRNRDSWLVNFWRREPHLAGVMSSVNSIDANRGWTLTGGRNQVMRFTPVFRDAEDGAGWRQYISLQSTSYYATDIGSLTETERDFKDGPLRKIYHLDPTKCYLTGRRNRPLHYNKSKEPWEPGDFFRLVSMRNVQEEFNGLGFCAVSRVLDMSKLMLAVYNHEFEQLGARAPRGLLLLQNIGQQQWQEAMKARDASLDTTLRRYYDAVAVIAQEGVESIDAKLVALSQLPQGFDLEVFTNLLMYAYALCFGYDPIEFWPVLAGQLGRGRETDIQHRKGTGKGGMNFMLAYQDQMQRELPNTLIFEFEQRDQEGALLDAEVAQAWANVVATLVGGGSSAAPGPAGSKGGDGEPVEAPESQPVPAAAKLKGAQQTGIISIEEARHMLVDQGIIHSSWTDEDEEVKATDSKSAAQRQREELLSNESILRAIYQYPNEPIVRYTYNARYPNGKTEVLFRNKEEALSRTRYSVLKPTLLLTEKPPVEEEDADNSEDVVGESDTGDLGRDRDLENYPEQHVPVSE